MTTVLAWASMLFSTNSAMAFSGFVCESAMMRIAFQSSPIRSLPFSVSFDLKVLVFVTLVWNSLQYSSQMAIEALSPHHPHQRVVRTREETHAPFSMGHRFQATTTE